MTSEKSDNGQEAVAPPNGKDETPDRVAELSRESASYRTQRNDAVRRAHAYETMLKAHGVDTGVVTDDALKALPIKAGKVDGQFQYTPPKIDVPRTEPAQRVEGKPALTLAELASGSDQELNIDQQKYFHFYVDDIDRAQARPNIMDDAMGRASRAMAKEVDTYIQGRVHANYNASRQSGIVTKAPGAADWGTDTIKELAKLKRMMTTAKLQQGDRWIIVDEDFMEGLDVHFGAGSDSAASVFQPATNEQTLRNGFAGMLLGFRLLVANSSRVPAGGSGNKRAYAGAGMEAITLARQIVENEAYRPEARFGDAVKGLMVYSAKVVLGAHLFSMEYKSSA